MEPDRGRILDLVRGMVGTGSVMLKVDADAAAGPFMQND